MSKILIIDDDTRLRNLLLKYLSDNGFEVKSAKDSIEAKEMIKTCNFNFIIVDVMLPGESGIEFTKKVRETNKKIFIIMLTAAREVDDKIKGLEAGADDYILKPFEPKELLLRIQNILKRQNNW